jgi:two-component system response regulator
MLRRPILLVEDNADHERLTLDTLGRLGVADDVLVVRDGAEARDYLFGIGSHSGRDSRDAPALILLELELPGIGALELLRRIRAHDDTKDIPVVVLSSVAVDEDRIRGHGLGASAYARKPLDLDRLLSAVRRIAEPSPDPQSALPH